MPLVHHRLPAVLTTCSFHQCTTVYIRCAVVCPHACQGNKFHRVVKGFCCQGGDIVRCEAPRGGAGGKQRPSCAWALGRRCRQLGYLMYDKNGNQGINP